MVQWHSRIRGQPDYYINNVETKTMERRLHCAEGFTKSGEKGQMINKTITAVLNRNSFPWPIVDFLFDWEPTASQSGVKKGDEINSFG